MLLLPDLCKVHPVFNIDMLECYKGTDRKTERIEIEADWVDWAMESTIAYWPENGNVKQHVYLVPWKDHSHEGNTWETYQHVVESDPKLLEEYYKSNLMVERDGRLSSRKVNKARRKQKWFFDLKFTLSECLVVLIWFWGLSGIIYFVYLLRRSTIEVTGPREGGVVRGCPLAAIMVLSS